MTNPIIPILLFLGVITFIGNLMNPAVPFSSNDVYIAINSERKKAGLNELTYSNKLESTAYNRALVIDSNQALEHGSNWSFELKTIFPEWKEVGENLAQGQKTIDELVQQWINSPEHKANIMNPKYTKTGISVTKGKIKGEEKTIIVQHFYD